MGLKQYLENKARMFVWENDEEYASLNDEQKKKVKEAFKVMYAIAFAVGLIYGIFWKTVYLIQTGFNKEEASKKLNERIDRL
jgi:hypothetical protein